MEIKKKLKNLFIGILALNFIIVVHEFGHFIFCKIFGVNTPIFSIGFNPKLFSYQIGKTSFQLGLIPLGGYVSIDSNQLRSLPFINNLLILFGGILFNLFLSLFIFLFINFKKSNLFKQKNNINQSLGFLGIINLLGSSFNLNIYNFLYFVAIVSFNIAIFNLLPLPFLDGGQIFLLIIEKIFGHIYFSQKFSNFFYYLILALFALFNIFLFKKDIIKLKKDN